MKNLARCAMVVCSQCGQRPLFFAKVLLRNFRRMKWWIDSVVEVTRAVKADDVSLKMQQEFYEKSRHLLDMQQ
ncbi:MAG TPA: hypothetical protein VGG04_05730 [Candidatus Sulfotelmatobacter sp.]